MFGTRLSSIPSWPLFDAVKPVPYSNCNQQMVGGMKWSKPEVSYETADGANACYDSAQN